jgi:hypothetical protein
MHQLGERTKLQSYHAKLAKPKKDLNPSLGTDCTEIETRVGKQEKRGKKYLKFGWWDYGGRFKSLKSLLELFS